jgi:hypothetical protein
MRPIPFILALVSLTGCAELHPYARVRCWEISGTVLDSRTHAAISGALVHRTEHLEFSCHTDSAGHFVLKEIPNWRRDPLPADLRITITHTNYATRQIEMADNQGKPLLLDRLEEPSNPRPSLIFSGAGTILQDMGGGQYLKPGDITFVKNAGGEPSELHIRFTRKVYEPQVRALRNPDKAKIYTYGSTDYQRDMDWEFRFQYKHPSNAKRVEDSSRVYRLDFIR